MKWLRHDTPGPRQDFSAKFVIFRPIFIDFFLFGNYIIMHVFLSTMKGKQNEKENLRCLISHTLFLLSEE